MYRALLELTDNTTGRPLFLPQATGTIQAPGAIGNLLGYPVLVSDAMPSEAAGAFAAVLLSRESYVVADRVGINSQVDPFTYGGSGITAWRTFVRSDGRWLRPTSSSRLQLAAS
jgi:HK97 family phage major capsid protein